MKRLLLIIVLFTNIFSQEFFNHKYEYKIQKEIDKIYDTLNDTIQDIDNPNYLIDCLDIINQLKKLEKKQNQLKVSKNWMVLQLFPSS